MNWKRFVIACLAVFGLFFLYDWLFHGILLAPSYAETPALWRPKETMMQYMPYMNAGQFFFVVMFCYIFTKGYEGRGIGEGLRYGLLIGLLLATHNLIWYAVQPLSGKLVAAWAVGNTLEAILGGGLLAAIYRAKGSPQTA